MPFARVPNGLRAAGENALVLRCIDRLLYPFRHPPSQAKSRNPPTNLTSDTVCIILHRLHRTAVDPRHIHMREEFTSRLRQALDKAQEEARELNQDFVSTEHLLLGLIGSEDSEAVDGLRLAGVGLGELRQNLIDALPRGTEPPVVTGNLPLSPKAMRAINAALVKAQSANVPRVTSRLLLVSLLDDSEPAMRTAMRAVGADLDHLQRVLGQDGAIQPET
jgi:hypothetical protein